MISLKQLYNIVLTSEDESFMTLLMNQTPLSAKYLIFTWKNSLKEISYAYFVTQTKGLIKTVPTLRTWTFQMSRSMNPKYAEADQIQTLQEELLLQNQQQQVPPKQREQQSPVKKVQKKKRMIITSSDEELAQLSEEEIQTKVKKKKHQTYLDNVKTQNHTGMSYTTANGTATHADVITDLLGQDFVHRECHQPMQQLHHTLYPCSSMQTKVKGVVTSLKLDQPAAHGQERTTTQQRHGELLIETKLFYTDHILGNVYIFLI